MPEDQDTAPTGEPEDSGQESGPPRPPTADATGPGKRLPLAELLVCSSIALAGIGLITAVISLVTDQHAGKVAGLAMITASLTLTTAAALINRWKYPAIGCAVAAGALLLATVAAALTTPGSIPGLAPAGTEAAGRLQSQWIWP